MFARCWRIHQATLARGLSRLRVACQNQRAKNCVAATRGRAAQELADSFLETPDAGDLDVTPLEPSAGGPLRRGHGLRAQGPEALRAHQLGIASLLYPVRGALGPGQLCDDPGGELAHVQAPPAAGLLVVAGAFRLALGAAGGTQPRIDGHRDLPALHIALYAHHAPRGPRPQEGAVPFRVAHGSSPPFEG
jgi:hypothetical protein